MQKIQRIPLEKRLRASSVQKEGCPAACWSYLDTYCRALSEMSGDRRYQERYYHAVMDGIYGNIEDNLVVQTAAEALSGDYPPEAAEEILYEMLIRPFTDRRIFGEKGGNAQ